MGMIEFLSRTLSQTFQVGGATGPQVKNNGGKLEVVDAAGSTTQAIVATPSANDHAANKAYVDGLVGDQGKVLEKRATAPPLSRSQRSRPAACSFDFNDAVAAGTGTVTSTPFSCRGASYALAALAPGALPPVADQPSRATTTMILKVRRRVDGARPSRPPA